MTLNSITIKGEQVRTTEHSAKTSSVETGLLAVLANLLRGHGRGAPAPVLSGGGSGRRVWSCVAVGCALVVLGLLAAAPALAAEPPVYLPPPRVEGIHPTRATLFAFAAIPPAGEQTYVKEERKEYATSESGPYTVLSILDRNAKGQDEFRVGGEQSGSLTHLTPATTYYARFFAETANGGSVTETLKFATPPPSAPEFFAPGGDEGLRIGKEDRIDKADASASFESAEIESNAAETTYAFEYATTEAGPYSPFPSGGTGKVTVAEEAARPEASLTGLAPETTYYIRVTAENAHGRVSETIPFETDSTKPFASTAVSSVTTTSALLSGSFQSDEFGVQWRLEYAATEGGPWSIAAEGTVSEAEVEAGQDSVGPVELSGLSPGSTYYVRMFVDNGHGTYTSENTGEPRGPERFRTPGPPVVATFATYALEGETLRALGQVHSGYIAYASGEYQTHYHLEYVGQRQFEATGWAGAASTSEAALEEHGGEPVDVVSEVFPGLTQGETYHYRFVASNTTSGDPVVDGNEETLTVPTPAPGEAQAACPNEAFRTGPSARLPDCRAYEQVTPEEKGGSQAAFSYVGALDFRGYLTSADGEHVFLHDPGVKWGSSPGPARDDYFFSRTASGWQMTSSKPVGEPGPADLEPEVFNPDLTQVGFEAIWDTGPAKSPDHEFKVGPPGGPYQVVASIPSSQEAVLVGESADGSKYVLESTDRTLAGHATGTTSGEDLYELSEGKASQLNVLGGAPGTPISTCGAKMAQYKEERLEVEPGRMEAGQEVKVENAVSADGSRVFFNDNCTHQLYMRVNGVETVDIGAYELLAANAQGTALALRNGAGEVVGYDAETGKIESPSGAVQASERELAELAIPVRHTPEAGDPVADSRDSYFVGNVAGLPHYREGYERQVFRYDSVEHVVECVSCASPFDPEPRFGAIFNGNNTVSDNNGNIPSTFAAAGSLAPPGVPFESLGGSANGDFVFFDTVSALVPQDVDGEREPERVYNTDELYSEEYSPSSDVYEWRKNGVDGCTRVQGCLSLITTGKGGFLNEFLGTDASGRDVFFTTDESLVPGDQDTESDIYDARIDGGFAAPAPRPAECEGDSCSTPLAAPDDLTPSSATFQGAGDLPGALPEAKSKSKPKTKKKAKHKAKRKAKPKRRAGKSTRGGRAVHRSHGGAK
jgi:hypothetical protein